MKVRRTIAWVVAALMAEPDAVVVAMAVALTAGPGVAVVAMAAALKAGPGAVVVFLQVVAWVVDFPYRMGCFSFVPKFSHCPSALPSPEPLSPLTNCSAERLACRSEAGPC